MKIHALTTGAVRVKHSFLYPRQGPRRRLDLFLPGAFSDPLPIHCWATRPTRSSSCTRCAPTQSHPTIYLPSHDPDAAARFAEATTSTRAPLPVA
jgi:hypothetical protein